jgi:hypothetical protein
MTLLLTWICCKAVELVNGNVFDGQVVENMQSAFCNVPVACHGDNEWTSWFGSAFLGNDFADAAQRHEDILEATVLVGPWQKLLYDVICIHPRGGLTLHSLKMAMKPRERGGHVQDW